MAPTNYPPNADRREGADPSDDSEFIERLRAGESAAFDALIKRNWRPLVLFLARQVRSVDAAKDLAQEAFVKLWRRRETLDPGASVVAYLYHIARNLAIDEHRRTAVRERWSEAEKRREDVGVLTPIDTLADQQLSEALERAIEGLPERRREAFVLIYVQNLSHREAALVMGTAVQTVANHVAAALAALRRVLKPHLADTVDWARERPRREDEGRSRAGP